MPLGNDPTPLTELEQSFGVTSSAAELIQANHAAITQEQRASLGKEINEPLTEHVKGELEALEDHIGGNVEIKDVAVRGAGSTALIHYVYEGSRGANEQDYVPFADVFGDDLLKRRRKTLQARQADPDEAAAAAAAAKVREADDEAAATLAKAREDADKLLAETQEKIAKMVADATAKVQEQRESVPEEAQKAAVAAREQAEKDRAAAPKPKPAAKKPAAS